MNVMILLGIETSEDASQAQKELEQWGVDVMAWWHDPLDQKMRVTIGSNFVFAQHTMLHLGYRPQFITFRRPK